MSHPQDAKSRFDFVPRPVALAAAHVRPKPIATKSTAKEADDDIISIPSSPPPASLQPAWSYPQVTQEMYEVRWGSHNPRHVQRAIALLRELVNFGEFCASHLRLTGDELRVLDVLESCLAGDAYWIARGEPRPPIRASPREPLVPVIQETWEEDLAMVRRARREGRTLSYRKVWRMRNQPSGELGCGLVLTPELRDTEPEKGDGPYDHIDAASVFFDYVTSEAFAEVHGALDKFEFGTLFLLRRHVVWWQREARLKAWIVAKENSKALEQAEGKHKLTENTTVVVPRRKVKG
ncbi:hypothetical protein PsYK624_063640 [Phanerochaete sordida]|uniref:Uncharacterized protein n=1 Tax=Phanerochaete sordida TaxID=48140 RepID=A0A9P3LCH1_9APHY|nr:hypothetical protein PsYK624_063640 [Phanerochaete sordida]